MKTRLTSLLLAAACGFCSTQAIAAPPVLPQTSLLLQAAPSAPPAAPIRLTPAWVVALSSVAVAIAAIGALLQYYEQQRWKRVEFIRSIIKEFESDPNIRNILSIIDFEEFRELPLQLPGRNETIFFEPSDRRLRNALLPHREAVARKRMVRVQGDPETYAQDLKEYLIEVTLRDWFDTFLSGLASFEYYIKSKLITAEELRPYLIHWIRRVGDREYRREGASGFYEQLFTYIHQADYTDVQKLFERFGYRILPTPYKESDFNASFAAHPAKRALSLGKVAYLAYSDERYIREILTRWGVNPAVDFRYIDDPNSETQGIIFRVGQQIILAFRGTQELRDWRTNVKMKLRKFASKSKLATLDTEIIGTLKPAQIFQDNASVHRGFQNAWDSVAPQVFEHVLRWRRVDPTSKLWITGHSLGGALATVAAAALQDQGVVVDGLYTFGQPRVGDWSFQRQFNKVLGDRTFRYVNNNDIVPEVPPPILPWTFPRVYRHVGQHFYFDVGGHLSQNPNLFKRVTDFALGYMAGTLEQGFEGINDHRMELYVAHLQKARAAERTELELAEEEESFLPQVDTKAAQKG